ncbi:pirin family protein [Mariniphaga sp.]|uniref:pirin family protein n=1 Tax=Mariniphaga sp. TaxID=1954475 RepID=UPI00356317C1
MSNIGHIIEERAANIGNFMVGRLLPFREKRTVGPFIFLDHMGPAQLSSSENLDVPPHPHIGLSTLTYLFEGALMHRDSLGSVQEIKPGAVNWMTAGKGVVHSERTPENLRDKEKTFHGLQIWIALPKDKELSEPSFTHVSAEDIPEWEQNGVKMKLIAGEAFGKKSPVPVYSPLYLIEMKNKEQTELNIGSQLFGESALYILEGSIKIEENIFEPNQLLVAKESSLCSFVLKKNSTVYLFGGEPFPEERFIYWNFVNSDKDQIEKAKKEWEEQNFPPIPGETDFVPLPKK